MRCKILKLIFLALFFFGCSATAETLKTAPDFSLPDLNGNNVQLSGQKGKVVFIDFWASWCPPCRASIPEVEKIYEELKGKDVVFLGINLENDAGIARDFVKKQGMKYTVLVGTNKVGNDYGIRGIPAFFIIDQEGKIAEKYVGFQPGMGREWADKINSLLAKPIKK